MKKDNIKSKQTFYFQLLSIIPMMLFLGIYFPSYIWLIAILSLFLFYNFCNLSHQRALLKLPLIAILTGSFLLYALLNLGDTNNPKTFKTLDGHNAFATFQLKQTSPIDKLCYYVGIDKNVKFKLSYAENSKWKEFYKYDKNFPFSYRWNCIDTNITSHEIMIQITQGSMMLNEIRFLHNQKPLPFNSKVKEFNDESHSPIGTTFKEGMYFDEIYHGRTAFEILHDMPVYETTHPYLGKIIISAGLEMFGMSPYGWRFMNVIFGSFFIFVVYYFALLLFKKREFAFASAFIMLYSFMHFTQARIALIDTFGVLFVIVSYYLLYLFIIKQRLKWLLLSGVVFGLASAVKWSAVFASLGFLAISIYLLLSKYPLEKRFSGYRLILYGLLSYAVIAVGVYFLTFMDIYLKTGNFYSIIEYQINMYNYHSSLVGTHAYSSPWWSWLLDMKPMSYYRVSENGLFSAIDCFGNPAIFWTGIVALLYLIYVVIRKRELEATFILLAFLALYLPYIFVSRLMFIYHFYYAVPFLILAIVYGLRDVMSWIGESRGEKLYFLFLALVVTLFLMFYPVLSGYEVDKSYVDNYLIWIKGWWL